MNIIFALATFIFLFSFPRPLFAIGATGCTPLPPTNLKVVCNGSTATVSWTPSTCADGYFLGGDDTINGWSGVCDAPNAGDYCQRIFDPSQSSFSIAANPLRAYNWGLQSFKDGVTGEQAMGVQFSCCSVTNPSNLNVRCQGNIAIASWTPATCADGYYIGGDDVINDWDVTGDCNAVFPGDVCYKLVGRTTSTARESTNPARTYRWGLQSYVGSTKGAQILGTPISCGPTSTPTPTLTLTPTTGPSPTAGPSPTPTTGPSPTQGPSPTISACTPTAPSDLKFTCSGARVTLSWKAATCAEGYFLTANDSKNTWSFSGDCAVDNPGGYCGKTLTTSYTQNSDPTLSYKWGLRSYNGTQKSDEVVSSFTCGSFKEGDLNFDGKVNIFDYNLFVADFNKSGTAGFVPADINKDGKVGIFDYNILVANFGK